MTNNTITLYVRLSADLKGWLDGVADTSGMSLAKVCEILLADQRDRGITVVSRTEQVTVS